LRPLLPRRSNGRAGHRAGGGRGRRL